MTDAQLETLSPGHYRLSGELSFASVPALLGQAQTLFGDAGDIRVSLAGVSRADSAGVALLIEWRRESDHRGRSIAFTDIPPQMLALAQVCGVDELLALDGQ